MESSNSWIITSSDLSSRIRKVSHLNSSYYRCTEAHPPGVVFVASCIRIGDCHVYFVSRASQCYDLILQVTNADALNSLLSILDAAEERLAARDGKPTVQPKVATTEAGGANPGPSTSGRRESAGKAGDKDGMSPAVSLGRRVTTESSAEASWILVRTEPERAVRPSRRVDNGILNEGGIPLGGK